MGDVIVEIRAAPADCWSCGADISIVSLIKLTRGSVTVECSIPDFTTHSHLIASIEQSLRERVQVGALKPRYSRTLSRSYMSNGCTHCDAIFGQHYEIRARYEESLAARFTASGADGWDALADELLSSEDGHIFQTYS